MFEKGIAVIAITRRGVETALKIKAALDTLGFPCKVFAPEKYRQTGIFSLDKKLDEFVKEIYRKVDAIIAVMAAGIIIRAVASHLESKLVDPAVLCVDVSGRFVISLLSGHYGRANELARLLAEGIDAVPVITTASDVMGKQSIEELALTLHLSIENPESLVAVNSALVNDGRLVLVLVGDVKIPESSIFPYEIKKVDTVEKAIELVNSYDAGAIITRENVPKAHLTKPATVLRPRMVVVGLGARQNVSESEVIDAVKYALARVDIPLKRVDRLATVSIKKDSPAIVNAAEKLGLPITFLEVEVLRAFKHEDLSPDSPVVEQNIGVGGVCERAALIEAGAKAKLILKKIKLNGVTVAIAEGE
ncbi:MAG: cobalamin biosynthesis protein [Candidatus Bathyarchaeota archaeon]|nr:cobalamin biosynthesis protein [Candidatus Bathyarchaeota archaeon]